MAVTIAEKNHWKERIARKIEKAINDLVASRDRHFLSMVEHEVRRRVIESVGVIEEYDRLQDIFKELGDLEAERQTVSERIRRKVPEFNCDWSWRRNAVDCLDSVLRDQMSIAEREVMKQSPLGRQLLKLRDEQEELLDTVWLATSPTEVQRLWSRMSSLLGQGMTELQREAVETPIPEVETKE